MDYKEDIHFSCYYGCPNTNNKDNLINRVNIVNKNSVVNVVNIVKSKSKRVITDEVPIMITSEIAKLLASF